MAANDKTIRLTHPIGARGVSGLEAATQGATVEVAIGSFRGPREALRSPRRLALLSRVPAASLPGAQTPAVVAPPRRPVAPPVTGPLALVVVDSEEAGWPFQNVLHSLGLRTLVRQGGLEALHAVTDYPPALVLLAAWRGPVDSRVFARTCQTKSAQS